MTTLEKKIEVLYLAISFEMNKIKITNVCDK